MEFPWNWQIKNNTNFRNNQRYAKNLPPAWLLMGWIKARVDPSFPREHVFLLESPWAPFKELSLSTPPRKRPIGFMLNWIKRLLIKTRLHKRKENTKDHHATDFDLSNSTLRSSSHEGWILLSFSTHESRNRNETWIKMSSSWTHLQRTASQQGKELHKRTKVSDVER